MCVRLTRNDVVQFDPSAGFGSNGIWFHDLGGTLIETQVTEKSSPNEKAGQNNPSSPPGVQGLHACFVAPMVYLRRLTHILLLSSDILCCIGFYSRMLGLRLSDRSGDGIAFTHGVIATTARMATYRAAKSTYIGAAV